MRVRSNGVSIDFSWSLLGCNFGGISRWMLRYFAGGDANHCAVRFDRIHYHRVRTHGYVIANVDSAQNLRAGAQYHVVADLRSQSEIKTQVHGFGAQGHALEDGDIAADAPRSNHGSRRVREEDPGPDLAARRDFQAEE